MSRPLGVTILLGALFIIGGVATIISGLLSLNIASVAVGIIFGVVQFIIGVGLA